MTKDEFKKEAQIKVETMLLNREKYGSLVSEADFLAGAMIVMCLVNELFFDGKNDSERDTSMNICPPLWTLYPMSGRSLVEELLQT